MSFDRDRNYTPDGQFYTHVDSDKLTRIDTHIVITIGYATQTHWIMIVRETLSSHEDGTHQGLEYAECLFSFWKHSYYKNGGSGPIPSGRRILGYYIEPDDEAGRLRHLRTCFHCGNEYLGSVYRTCPGCGRVVGVSTVFRAIFNWLAEHRSFNPGRW